MRKMIKFCLFILGVSFFNLQAQAGTDSLISTGYQVEQASSNNLARADILTDKYEKNTVHIKEDWRLIDTPTGSEVYRLYVSTQALAKAGIKVSTTAEAVPVYVKTTQGYEPVLVGEKGQYNQLVGGSTAGNGLVVATDGFILTTRSIGTPWNLEMKFADETPGILMSADFKRVLETNAPPPTNWVPVKTKSQRGSFGKLNLKVNTSGKYSFRTPKMEVNLPGTDTVVGNAQLISTSIKYDLAMIKIDVPGPLETAEFYDNYNTLKKGMNLSLVFNELSSIPEKQKLNVLKTTVNSDVQAEKDGGIILAAGFDNSAASAPGLAASDLQGYFKDFSYAGSPVFDDQGRIIGIYSGYTRKNDTNYIIPVRIARQFIGK